MHIGHESPMEMSGEMSRNHRRETSVEDKVPATHLYKCDLTKPIAVCNKYVRKQNKN